MKLYLDGRNLMVEGATQSDILGGSFRNFRGEKRKFNDAGRRNFNIVIPPEYLDLLIDMKCNVKELAPRDDDGEQPLRFVKVNVAFGQYPPHLYLCTKKNKKELLQDELGLLDGAVFDNVDMIIRTYHRDEDSCSLYLNNGFFTLRTDPITAKYEALVDVAEDGSEDEEEVPFD